MLDGFTVIRNGIGFNVHVGPVAVKSNAHFFSDSDNTIDAGMKRIIPSCPYILSRMPLVATLSDNDVVSLRFSAYAKKQNAKNYKLERLVLESVYRQKF